MATNFEDAYKAYTEGGRGQAVAGVYDAQTQAELNGLKSTYEQNLSNQQAAREKIAGAYQQSGNAMQAQYERNRRNLNQQAAANGINTGAGSQQQLALQNVWNRDYGNLMGQQAQAYADADRAIADLQVTYQNAIQQAQAQGDYRKMAALLDDYQQAYNQQLQQAQTLASYGDFSGYNGIYSADQIANMRNAWIASNPQMAYNMGLITAEELARMTGGAAGGSGGRSYGGGGYYSGSSGGGGDSGNGNAADNGWPGGIEPPPEGASQREIDAYLNKLVDAGVIGRRAADDIRNGDRPLSSSRTAVPPVASKPAASTPATSAPAVSTTSNSRSSVVAKPGMNRGYTDTATSNLGAQTLPANKRFLSAASALSAANPVPTYPFNTNYVNIGPAGTGVRTLEKK